MIKYLSFLFIFLFTNIISANPQFEGTITDQLTDKPIKNAVIAIPAFNIETVSDTNGYFSLSGIPAGKYDLLFGAKNYLTAYLKDVTFITPVLKQKTGIYKFNTSVINQIYTVPVLRIAIPTGDVQHIKIDFFDLKGRKIAKTLEKVLVPGYHTIRLNNLKNISSAYIFCRIKESNGKTHIEKIKVK